MTLNVDRCDGCGRFIANDAPIEIEETHRMSIAGDLDVNEYHYCERCSRRSALG